MEKMRLSERFEKRNNITRKSKKPTVTLNLESSDAVIRYHNPVSLENIYIFLKEK
jgi:hypothetical protein